ncbi:Gfo/Idh/MocA family oxidoreductase [Luteolibacter sp. LG18]|uniref:Gfo/Idh/MocA family protein n=1 Tax=Luteolibacter sp. LG18 TaxID=2819286 RepID=UPI002B2B4CDD|nr:oxidoreductase [Luteolibacter sp. LG18]
MKFGIIGAGMIGRFHATAIQQMTGGELHSVFDLRAEGAEKLASEFGAKPYSDIDAFLADPELEIVTIGTPSGAHLDPALASLNAGKHVICEKPLEVTPERIDLMMAAAEKNGVTLAAVLNRRFHPALEHFKAAAEAGRFGKITSASCYVKWWRSQEYYDSAGWRGTWALDGGGALMNQSIHTIDTLIHVAGPIKAVTARAELIAHERIEVEDAAVALVEFESGALGVIEGSTACWSSTGHPAEVQVCGTKGSVFLADESFKIWDFADATAEDDFVRANLMTTSAAGLGANDPSAINVTGHIRNFEETVNAIQEGRVPTVSAAEARKAVAVICAIYQSAREGGKRVTL